MSKQYLTPEEINARLAETRDQTFRSKSQKQIDGYNYRSANPNWKKKVTEGNKLRGTPAQKCQIKPLDGTWKTFRSISSAAIYYNWLKWKDRPTESFPTDGTIKTFKRGQFKGWQTRRIID